MPNDAKPELTLFFDILQTLERLEIPYVVIGAFAATFYGITRMTYDIDIVVDLDDAKIELLAEAYPLPRYYADPYQMRNAINIRSMFNIIDTDRGEKADLVPLNMDNRNQSALTQRVRQAVELPNGESAEIWIARPEDVILAS